MQGIRFFVSRPHRTAGKRPISDEDNDDMAMKVVIICNSAVIEDTVDIFLLKSTFPQSVLSKELKD